MGNFTQTLYPKRSVDKNPFVFDRPVDDSNLFVSREKALSWVFDNLDNSLNMPLTIHGAQGIGRTTFLGQVHKEASLQEIIPIYVNLKQMPLDSFSEFLWVFGKTIVGGLADIGLSAPPLEKRMLILRPRQAFHQSFWRQLIEDYKGRRILLIFDNFESLANKSISAEVNREYRQYLFSLLEESQNVFALTSFAGRIETYDPMELAPFHPTLNYRISQFTEKQTGDLINQNPVLSIQKSLTSYIFSLTRGHPADIQRLCHAIFERMQLYNFRVVTVADVVSTLRTDLKPADFRRPIYHIKENLSYPSGQG